MGLYGVEGEVKLAGDFFIALALKAELVDFTEGVGKFGNGFFEEKVNLFFNNVVKEKFMTFFVHHFLGIAFACLFVLQLVDAAVFNGGVEPGFEGFDGVKLHFAAVEFEEDVMDNVLGIIVVFDILCGKDAEHLVVFFEKFAVGFFIALAKSFQPFIFRCFHVASI